MMHPFLVFAIILIVIWTLSAIATAVNKQKEMERRRRMRMELERATRGGAALSRQPTQEPWEVREAVANRFPDVPLPPQPAPPARRPTPRTAKLPPKAIPQPRPVPRQQPKKQTKRKVARSAPLLVEEPKPPVQRLTAAQAAPPLPPAAPTAPAPRAVNAVALSRWLQPETLRQQFILTEVFQPPLAMRPQRDPLA